MILSKDVFAQGTQAGTRPLTRINRETRHAWAAAVGSVTIQVCVFGGVFAAPVFSLAGWVGLVMPTTTPLHQMASPLITLALVWLFLALAATHLVRGERQPRGLAGGISGQSMPHSSSGRSPE